MKIKWGVRNIIHIVLFAINILDMLLSLIFFQKDLMVYVTLLAFLSVPIIFFFFDNEEKIPFLRTHFLIDMFLVLSIISLFLFR